MKKNYLLNCINKYFLIILATIFFFLIGGKDVYAVDEIRFQALINDEADLLTNEEEQQLMEDMGKLLDYGHVVFQTVTLSTSNYESYAEDSYYQMFGNEPGVLFQIDMGNRKLTLCASTKMEELIGKERDSIVDNIYEMASEADYYDCARECFDEIFIVLNDGKIAHEMKYINNLIFALILALIINFILVFATNRKKVSMKKLLGEMAVATAISGAVLHTGKVTKRYSPIESSSSSGGGSSGGGGGGGFSGGSSSHGF